MVQSVLSVAAAIIIEASLSFLGIGVRPPTASWGSMLRSGYGYIEMAPWLSVAPGLAIFATVLAVNFLGEGFQDALDLAGGKRNASDSLCARTELYSKGTPHAVGTDSR